MDISTDGCRSELNRTSPYADVMQTVRSILRRLVEWFTLKDADRIRAGIYIRRRGA